MCTAGAHHGCADRSSADELQTGRALLALEANTRILAVAAKSDIGESPQRRPPLYPMHGR
jgi:hypothetical protein